MCLIKCLAQMRKLVIRHILTIHYLSCIAIFWLVINIRIYKHYQQHSYKIVLIHRLLLCSRWVSSKKNIPNCRKKLYQPLKNYNNWSIRILCMIKRRILFAIWHFRKLIPAKSIWCISTNGSWIKELESVMSSSSEDRSSRRL